MNIHPMARTTPKTRAEIHESKAGVSEISKTYNISRSSARKWHNRSDHLDRSHRPKQLHTTLSSAQEAIVLEIRRLCLLLLDDLVSVTQEFINAKASRSGISRLLRREGMSDLAKLQTPAEGERVTKKSFKDYEPGYVHVDIKYLPQMPDETTRRYLFVAIDRATRWVFVRTYRDQSERSSVDFLRRLHSTAPFKITKLLTDNGSQFTDRFTSKQQHPTGQHAFDKQCHLFGIEHRLIPPSHPQTNGMVERFNRRIDDVVAQTRFASSAELDSTLKHYIPQRSLGHISPADSLKSWHLKLPHLFIKRVYKQAELDTSEIP